MTEHLDDYKRDRHPDAREFELAFLREYVDPAPGWDLDALMTGCGMSAFTTVLAFLIMEGQAPRKALMGSSLYHECRDLIARSELGTRLIEVEDARVAPVLGAIERERPDVVFLDSLANARGLAVPDIAAIAGRLAAQARPESGRWLVVDNTGLSVACQPFALAPSPPEGFELVVFESLTKYAQFGLDRTTAGMIVASRDVARRLSGYREHLGTNVPDTAVHMIPRPDRVVFDRRLARLHRNAAALAEHLHVGALEIGGDVITGITYPGLPHHPSHLVARGMSFHGGFFAIDFGRGHDTYETHQRFVKAALYEAERQGVPLTAGASFGLNTTRVYLTASTSELGRPFVRISAGTEHRLGVEALKEVLTAALAITAG
jgi:cystathionine beta-lyase/cystathionine gamma-synthase